MTGPSDNGVMAWMWFVQSGESIDGPLSSEEVQERFHGGQLNAQNLIWGRGLESWQRLDAWSKGLAEFTSATLTDISQQETWHYAANGQSHGPMARETLIGALKGLDSLSDLLVWTKGMKEWAPLFEFHDLLAEIGVNKRQFPRADLTGKASLRIENKILVANLVTISEGGFGLSLAAGTLNAGQVVTAELSSPAFREPLHVKAEVRYAAQDIVGMKFTQISVESRGAIIQYIKHNQIRFQIKAA